MSVKGAEIIGASVCGGTVSYQLDTEQETELWSERRQKYEICALTGSLRWCNTLPLWCVWIPIIYDVNRPLVSSLKQPINAFQLNPANCIGNWCLGVLLQHTVGSWAAKQPRLHTSRAEWHLTTKRWHCSHLERPGSLVKLAAVKSVSSNWDYR